MPPKKFRGQSAQGFLPTPPHTREIAQNLRMFTSLLSFHPSPYSVLHKEVPFKVRKFNFKM